MDNQIEIKRRYIYSLYRNIDISILNIIYIYIIYIYIYHNSGYKRVVYYGGTPNVRM